MLSEAFSSPSSSTTNLNSEELISEGSATSLGVTNIDDELSSRSADNLLPSRKLSRQPKSDSALSTTAQKSRASKPLPVGDKEVVAGLEAAVGEMELEAKRKTSKDSESRTKGSKGSVSGLEEGKVASGTGSESKRKSSKGTESRTTKRNSMSDIEDSPADPVKKKVMSPRRSSESNIIVVSPKKQLPQSSLKESKGSGKAADISMTPGGRATGGQRRNLAESRRPSDGNLPRPDADAPVSRLRSATTGHISLVTDRPSSAAPNGHSADRAKKKPTKLAPVARPISAQPSQALRRMAEQKRLEEEREKEERERKEEEKTVAARVVKKQGSETDGEAMVGEVAEAQVEGERKRGDREALSLKDSVTIPSANGTPTHKKSLPVSIL